MSISALYDQLFFFNNPMPDEKNISPRIASAHGLNATRFLPKIPTTPRIRPIIPATVSVNANALIILFYLRFIKLDSSMRFFYNLMPACLTDTEK
jgi:hypothetical protein